MADKNDIDLLNDPVKLASAILAEQNETLRSRFQSKPQDPIREFLKERGVRLGVMREK